MVTMKPYNRRQFCLWVLLSISALSVVQTSRVVADDINAANFELQQLRKQRRRAVHRQRRLIFNNDGNSIVYTHQDKPITGDALLADRTTPLVGTHVDAVFYCPWNVSLVRCTHISSVTEPFYANTGIFAKNQTRAFHEQGLDPLRLMVDFCRQQGIEIFMSMRMNDIHDAYPQWPEMLSVFKKEHPHLLFGSRANPPAYGFWSGLDYGQPEVRDRAFQILEDVCRRYDVDGIQLDWLRHPPHFRCSAQGLDCTPRELDIMNQFQRRVRDMTERIGLKRDRPILIAARLPASIECCAALGLDVRHWLEHDLVDMLNPGEFELSPWNEWVELGHQHDVPVYPCLTWSWSRRREGPPGTEENLALRNFRARAMNVWQAGADGIHVFNLFDPQSSLWREIGDPQVLAKLDKDYFPDGFSWFLTGRHIRDPLRFLTLPTSLGLRHPVRLEPTQPYTIKMTMSEVDVGPAAASEETAGDPTVTLSLLIEGLQDADGLQVRLNDNSLVDGKMHASWVRYRASFDWFSTGLNSIRVINGHSADNSGHASGIVLQDVHLQFDYPDQD